MALPRRSGRLRTFVGVWTRYCYVVIAQLCLVCFFGWMATTLSFGDRWLWLFLLNSLTLYLFILLLLLLLPGLLWRRRGILLAGGLALLLGALFYVPLLVPKSFSRPAARPELTLMTFNLLGTNPRFERLPATLLASDADIIVLQELTPAAAVVLQRELLQAYPYQILEPEASAHGLGVLSRVPLQRSQHAPNDMRWVHPPQVLELALDGRRVTLVHFHLNATLGGSVAALEQAIRLREAQAGALADFAAGLGQPVILLGDFNATDRSSAYCIMTGRLGDAWRAAGRGFGHTWPGAAQDGSAGAPGVGVSMPRWLFRVDFIFHSQEWQPVSTRIGPWDTRSDHRPVLATLQLPR